MIFSGKVLAACVCFIISLSCITFAETKPAVSVRLGEMLGVGSIRDVSVTFVSDETLALLVHEGDLSNYVARLLLVRLTTKALRVLTDTTVGRDAADLYLVSEGRVVVAGSRGNFVCESTLAGSQRLPMRVLVAPFPGSGVVGEFRVDGWSVVRLDGTFSRAREGPGILESLSDQVVVYRFNGNIVSDSNDGRRLGSFALPANAGDSRIVEVVDGNRLYLALHGREGIVDFEGKLEQNLIPPPGWGSHRWSRDGGRMLFDNYKRTIPASQRVMEMLAAIVTLGLGVPDEEANGEEITVIDTHSAHMCFHRDSPEKLLGSPGRMHADVSPSGRWVAVATLTDLSIYRLPETCSAK